MYLWIIKRLNISAQLEYITVALYVEEIRAECIVINERNISHFLSCKLSRLYQLAFGSQLHLCLPNSYSETQSKTKRRQKTKQINVLSNLLRAAVLIFFIAFLMASFSITLPLPQQLSMKLSISLLLKKHNRFFVFFRNINSMDSHKVKIEILIYVVFIIKLNAV